MHGEMTFAEYARLVKGATGQQLIDAMTKTHDKRRAEGFRLKSMSIHYRNLMGNGIDLRPNHERLDIWHYYLQIQRGLLELEGKPAGLAFAELDVIAARQQPVQDKYFAEYGPFGAIPLEAALDPKTRLRVAKNIYYLECHGWLEPDEYNGLQFIWEAPDDSK